MVRTLKARGTRTLASLIPAAALAAAGIAMAAVPGYAACHSFTISVAPSSVAEGGSTKATISRDGALNPSSIQVDTVDETAVAGRDYTAIHQRLSFTTETSQTIQVTTIHNPAHEGSQTFRIQLSNGMGCAIHPNFVYGPPARVTVLDTDPAPAGSPPGSGTTTSAPTPAAHPAVSPVPGADGSVPSPGATDSAAPEVAQATSPSPTAGSPGPGSGSASSGRTSGAAAGPPGIVIVAVVAALVIMAAGTLYLVRKRRSAPSTNGLPDADARH